MEKEELYRYVDHTALKAFTTWKDIEKLCEEAIKYHTASVCIPSCYISRVKETYGDKIKICTVVGFPLGYANTEGKLAETKKALEDGAEEIDMVINICDVKNGAYHKVEEEIRLLKEATGDRILKVIIETCYLTKEEKIAMCHAVTNAGADFIKTSTGFGTAGATMEDVLLMKEHIGAEVKIKAAGGIRTKEDMENYIQSSGRYSLEASITNAAMAETVCRQSRCELVLMDVCTEDDESGLVAAEQIKKSVMETDKRQLLEAAKEAKKYSYAPYSNFHVGAALYCKDGSIYTGCNIENAAFTPTNCAERTAVFKAVSEKIFWQLL